jgi:uncharacterized zinc-type alcohol dehydrogenase-like protein
MVDETGPLVTQAYGCTAAGEKLALMDVTLPELKATDLELDMELCGLCHTDIHMRDNDWGISDYPLVPGHEGVGIVRKVGSAVGDKFKVGDRVGVGWIRGSCKVCEECLQGHENLCEKGYQGTFLGPSAGCWGKNPQNACGGCFAKVMRVDERYVVRVPENIPSEVVAPLMCAGGTVFEPICNYVKPGMKVAIGSIGGLGTCAIKLAKSQGAHVTALSRVGSSKREKCLRIGAKDFYACLGDKDKMKALAGKFDVIIDTCPANSDVGSYLEMLKFGGTYCRVGIPPHADSSFKNDYIPLIFTQKTIAGSIVTGMFRMYQMVRIASEDPDTFLDDPKEWNTKVVPFDKVNEVMDDLLNGKNTSNYRYVLKW